MRSLRDRIEAVLFVAAEAVSEKELCAVTGAPPAEVKTALADLERRYRDGGIVLRRLGGGWRLSSDPACRDAVERYLLPPKTYMSPASLETLAIVAYLQPVTRPEIESLRGVNVDGVVETLEQRGLIEEVGRKEVVGRPILYGTTQTFLEAFGLASLDDLPALPEGAPERKNGRLTLVGGREMAMEQIRESVEGHEDEIAPHTESTLVRTVADEIAASEE